MNDPDGIFQLREVRKFEVIIYQKYTNFKVRKKLGWNESCPADHITNYITNRSCNWMLYSRASQKTNICLNMGAFYLVFLKEHDNCDIFNYS